MAVNVLPLDRYLRGVVPWEVPKGWHEATYEAQAVAARSYTLATFNPGRTSTSSRISGRRCTAAFAAERPQTNLAIGATAGQVLVWRDRIDPGLLLLHLGRPNVVGPRRVAARAPGSVPRLGRRPVRLHLAAPCLADVCCSARAGRARPWGARRARLQSSSTTPRAVRRPCVADGERLEAVPAEVVRETFALGSTDFEVRAMSLDAPQPASLFGDQSTYTAGCAGSARRGSRS